MDILYPPGPASVPANLTQPSRQYRRKAWLAMGGLALFVLLYCSLSGWFAWHAYKLLGGAIRGGEHAFIGFVVGLPAAFLAVFMLKALFFVKHGGKSEDIEVSAKDEPQLFEFLHRLADEAGAPRPHRVYLSPRVNAAVFYDLSVLNLLFPSKKNLEIGLALVNVLTLGELKAVLAHEFGHFAQRSMAVGRWVYIAQQIAAHIVAKRDALDDFLRAISGIDFRIAWVGWLLSLIVWSIRSLLETAFRLVLIAQRALSREMEMQADLVAVSLTGSDALIHALHRLQAADDAWDRTLSFADGEYAEGRMTRDLFAVQSRVIAHMRTVLDQPDYGRSPTLPAERPEAHRVFEVDFARPPQMWATHPLNHEREHNAKRLYVPAGIDPRSAWSLFADPQQLRERMSAHLVRGAEKKAEPVDTEASLKALDEQFQHEYLNRFYRGVYLGRSVVREAASVDALYGRLDGSVADALAAIYPETLGKELEQLRRLEKEKALLESLHDGAMQATDGVIRHRGRQLRRAELPAAIAQVGRELAALRERLLEHDRRCRSAHLAAAEQLGQGWPAYLRGLAAVLHYADHREADLRDAQGALGNVIAVETAAGKVGKAGVTRVLASANALHRILAGIYGQADTVQPDAALLERMKVASWPEALGKFELPPASEQNINDWVRAIDGWVNSAAGALSALRQAALGQLLQAEATVARLLREAGEVPPAAPASAVLAEYPTLLPGQERQRQSRIGWWARFQTADGALAATARLLVAGGIIGAVLGFGGSAGTATVTVYNGLARQVQVEIAGHALAVAPHGTARLDVSPDGIGTVRSATYDGVAIEAFEPEFDGSLAHYVYNVAAAGPLVEWTAAYGNASAPPERLLGASRWQRVSADVLFDEPPSQVSTKGGSATRTVLTGLGDRAPDLALDAVQDPAQRAAMVAAHARWDGADSPYVMHWLGNAFQTAGFGAILAGRLHDHPHEVLSLRLEQEAAGEAGRAAVCGRQRLLAARAPDDADLQYLAARCQDDAAAREQAFLAGRRRWPQNAWFALADGYGQAEQGRWREAGESFEAVLAKLPAMADAVGLDLARVRRMQGRDDLADLLPRSRALGFMWALETGDKLDADSPLRGYAALARGEIGQALRLAHADAAAEMRLLRLAAASDGAEPALAARALAAGKDGLDEDGSWAMLALAIRAHADDAPYRGQLDRLKPDEKATLLAFVDALKAGEGAAAGRKLGHLTPLSLGHAYALGTVVLGKAAPAAWRDGAKRLLFASERPYFS
ncbi:M48 family metallopeptidase [Chitinimonas koreensis]|uniref:M48 family metallopeptidase n=1 Tax=Chitinimonas koreensis TaxID=356302 RepID=UPI0003FD294D|nr:M48 family metallopeptidase [Chitinimonas koreensis]